MRLEHESVEKLKSSVLNIIGKYLNLNEYKVFFFGSRITGTSDEYSDIDIGIEGPSEISLSVIGEIRDELNKLPMLYKIDVIDFTQTTDRFKEVAKNKIEYVQ